MKTFKVNFTEQQFNKLQVVISKFFYEFGYKNVGLEFQELVDILNEASERAETDVVSVKPTDEKANEKSDVKK